MIKAGDYIKITKDLSSVAWDFELLEEHEVKTLTGNIYKVILVIGNKFNEYCVEFDNTRKIYLFKNEIVKANIVDMWKKFVDEREEMFY